MKFSALNIVSLSHNDRFPVYRSRAVTQKDDDRGIPFGASAQRRISLLSLSLSLSLSMLKVPNVEEKNEHVARHVMHFSNSFLHFHSFNNHITTLYRGGGERVHRKVEHGVPTLLVGIVFFCSQTITDIYGWKLPTLE